MRLGSQYWRRRRRDGSYRMKVLLSAPDPSATFGRLIRVVTNDKFPLHKVL